MSKVVCCQRVSNAVQCVLNSHNAMAELAASCQSMKDISLTADLQTETFERLSQDDNEEEKERDPNYHEERFRVDRRKLEQMIQGGEVLSS